MPVNGPAATATGVGVLLLYGAVKNESFLAVVKDVITGKQPPSSGPADITAAASSTGSSGGGSSVTAAGAAPTTVSGNVALGKMMAAQRGWTGAQWNALYDLWVEESGWRTTAQNPTSPAYGIPQADPGDKMASAGADWRTNPATQIKWGLDYIAGSYGDPVHAYAFENSHTPHWY
jgi:hypothetical protein